MKSTIEISRETLVEMYNNGLSLAKIANELGTTRKVITRFFKNYNIELDPQRKFSRWANTKTVLEQLIEKYSKEEVEDLYIKQNKSNEDLQKLFGVKESQISELLKYYGIHKDKAAANEIAFQKKFEKWGGEEAYNKYLVAKSNETYIKNYGSLLAFTEHKSKKIRDYWNSLSETDIAARDAKIVATCKEKYGVDYFCQTKECRDVSGNKSGPNKEFAKLLSDNNISFEQEFNIESYSYDFKVNNILIEINPSYTHNSSFGIFNRTPLISHYHQDKTLKAEEAGFRCIHVFDWDDKYKIVKLLLPRERIFARDCSIKLVDKLEASKFINQNHLQGYAKSNINVGLYYKDELISIMTFDKPRYNKNYEYELIRYCSNKLVVGGSKKLFKFFLDNFNPKSVISYCDNAKFNGTTYIELGFSLLKYGKPSKHWYNPKTKAHYTDNLLRQRGFSQLVNKSTAEKDELVGASNRALMLEAGFVEIYDAGQSVYIYTR